MGYKHKEILMQTELCKEETLVKLFKDIQKLLQPNRKEYFALFINKSFKNSFAHFYGFNNTLLKRGVTINPDFFSSLAESETDKKALLVFALAHEVAHHELRHSDNTSRGPYNGFFRMKSELEADDLAGRMVAALSEVNINFFERILPKIFSEDSVLTSHPNRKYRILAAIGGFIEQKQGNTESGWSVNRTFRYYVGDREAVDTVFEGKFENSEKSFYYGTFLKNGQLDGIGIEISKTKSGVGFIYLGNFNNGKYEGRGEVFWETGEFYSGDFAEGKRQGYGNYSYRSGATYLGEFVNNMEYGSGRFWDIHGNQYIGSFDNGKFNGYGSYYYADGRVYKGQFLNGKFHGDGYMFRGSELINWGYWEEGSWISRSR
jgi:hypothetical protein